MSRQREFQERNLKKGICQNCGKPRFKNGVYCYAHTIYSRNYQRERAGYKPWRQGGRGRPPREAVARAKGTEAAS